MHARPLASLMGLDPVSLWATRHDLWRMKLVVSHHELEGGAFKFPARVSSSGFTLWLTVECVSFLLQLPSLPVEASCLHMQWEIPNHNHFRVMLWLEFAGGWEGRVSSVWIARETKEALYSTCY